MKKTLAALALGATLIAGTASAQDTAMTMDVALSMLELSVDRELQKYGFEDQDVMNLTLNQLATIKHVAGSSDYGSNERAKQIQAILAQ